MDTNKFHITSKRDSPTLDKIGWQTLDNGGKLCSFNEKVMID